MADTNAELEDDGGVLLHDEIADILRASGIEWMTTQEIADQVNARGRYHKRDGSEVTAFQIHGRTRNYSDLFEREGSRVRLRVAPRAGMMLTFNHFLGIAKLDPSETRLVRHRDSRFQRQVYDAAPKGDQSFERYQETQGNPKVIQQFRTARYIAGFVAEPLSKETIFVGVWERIGERPTAWTNSHQPAAGIQVRPSAVSFELRHLEAISEYSGRLVIDWGDGERAWVQRAERQEKPVIELRKEKSDPPFRGLLNLKRGLDEVASFRREARNGSLDFPLELAAAGFLARVCCVHEPG